VNHVGQLLPFYQNVSGALDIESLFEVTEGVAHVVAAQPLERLYEVMGSFCRPIGAQIVALEQAGTQIDEKDKRKVAGTLLCLLNLMIDNVELLTIFIQTITPYVEPSQEHPAVHLLSDLWPVLTETLNIFGSTQYISESVAKCFKNIIYAYRIHSLPLLGPMAEILVTSFERYEYGCFLWASGAIVRQFGHEDVEDDVRSAIWQFVERQCINTFHLLEKNKPNDIPDCIIPLHIKTLMRNSD
jgi:transportin-3